MHSRFYPSRLLSGYIQRNFKFRFTTELVTYLSNSRSFSVRDDMNFDNSTLYDPKPDKTDQENDALKYQYLLKSQAHKPKEEIERSLEQSSLPLDDDLVINVLQRHRSDWKPAYVFFNWVSGGGNRSGYFPGSDANNEILDILGRIKRWVSGGGNRSGYFPGSDAYNEILDILGRMKRFEEFTQVLDEMRNRNVANERTFAIVLNRYAAAHKVDEAIEFFNKRKEVGLESDLVAFQTLLLCLCRYKHVEAAEFLFRSRQNEFPFDIKTMNIILNGWCVLGSLHEAKRFWKDIVTDGKCKPDRFTYGTFINALTKAGKATTALKLLRAMWAKGCDPDVAICNCVIDGLCFKKRIPEALAIFQEMNDRGCLPNVGTYNTLIKHLCKIRRMEKVHELWDEMEHKGGSCLPNAMTYGYLLKSAKNAEEVPVILQRMERFGGKLTSDTYNLLLRLFMDWDHQERVESLWFEMERDGLGPDRRSYTVLIHGHYDKGRMEEAMNYFNEMTAKGMVPEPRTKILVDAMTTKMNERLGEAKDTRVMQRGGRSQFQCKARRDNGKES